MDQPKTEEGATVARKKPEHVDAAAWLLNLGEKYPRAARNVPGVMDRIKAGLRAERDRLAVESRISRLSADIKAAEQESHEMSETIADLEAVKRELAPIVAVLP